MLKCLIMAGGKGTRFWPVSTQEKPKQYTQLFSKKSLLQDTLYRLGSVTNKNDIYVVTVKNQLSLVKEQGKDLLVDKNIILEPQGRNTAPCIFFGLVRLLADGHHADDVVAVLPSDHVIMDKNGFDDTLNNAAKLAKEHMKIVTIGIKPSSAHTGYGYIQRGEQLSTGNRVLSFKEKPNLQKAQEYIQDGRYLWNAGMFIAPISLLMSEFEQHANDYFKLKNELQAALDDEDALKAVYERLPKDSIDYVIMEKSDQVSVIEAQFDWNDLGSWDALEEVIEEEDDNTLASKISFRQIESSGNIIYAPDKKVSLIGVKDLVIVSINDQLMILPKELAQRVKELST